LATVRFRTPTFPKQERLAELINDTPEGVMNEQEDEAVRQRAYRIWQDRGRPNGEHESLWHQALKELGLVSPVDASEDPEYPMSEPGNQRRPD
jgi:hypothetical protein